MKTRKYIILLVLGIILTIGLLFGSILLLRLFYLSVLVLIFNRLWVVLSARRLVLRVGPLPEHLQVGDEFWRDVTLDNESSLPSLWLQLKDQTELVHQDAAIISLPGHTTTSWKNNFKCERRGLFNVGPMTVTASDPLGIFSKQLTLGERQPVLVYPKTVDLPHFKFSSFSDFGYGSGYQSINRISPNASGVREYASGDSLHHIHWNSTLRTGQIMVKMFDADRSYNAAKVGWVLVDMNEESHFGRKLDTTDEQAVTIAASVARNYIQGGMRVGLMASDANRSFIAPDRGDPQLWRLLEKLALMKTDWKLTLNEIVSNHSEEFRDNPLLIIVATTVSAGLMETVHLLRNRVESVVVVLIDVASWRGSPVLTDAGRRLAWTGAQVYMVYKGEELSRSLDSKITHLHTAVV